MYYRLHEDLQYIVVIAGVFCLYFSARTMQCKALQWTYITTYCKIKNKTADKSNRKRKD